MTQVQMRPLEVAVCLGNYTWYGVMIEIPDNTPEDQIKRVASEIALAHPCCRDADIVAHVWVYNSMEDSRPEKIQETA